MPPLDACRIALWHTLKPILFAAAASLFGMAAHAGSCNVTTPGAATCAIPAGVASVTVVATGAGGAAGSSLTAPGGNGGVVTQTLTGVGGTTLNLFVGGGGGAGGTSGAGGGASSVNAGTVSQIIAGGGGGGSSSANSYGGDGNGSVGGYGGLGLPGAGGAGGVGGARGGPPAVAGGSGNGGAGGLGSSSAGGLGSGSGSGGASPGGGGGGGGYGGGYGGGGGAGGSAGGGGGGSTGGTVTVASNGGVPLRGQGGDGSIIINWSDPVLVPIPTLTNQPAVSGIGTQPATVDLTAGQGPSMTSCLLATVQSLFGSDATYAGQATSGVAKFSQGGRTIAFYPLQATTQSGLGAGIGLTAANVLTVGTACGSFTVAPALSNLTEFGALLNGMGLQANTSAQGVVTVTAGNTVFVFRPDYLVTSGTPGAPSLTLGADGLYRFTDSSGNVQILRPAFVDTDGLGAQAPLALAQSGSISIQTDGTALFTPVTGLQQYVLTPDLTLTVAPVAKASSFWWTDVANHYLFRSSLLTSAQGITVRQK